MEREYSLGNGFGELPSDGDFSDREMPISAIPATKKRKKRKNMSGKKVNVTDLDNYIIGREKYHDDLRKKLNGIGIEIDKQGKIIGNPKFIYTTESGGQAEVEIKNLNKAGGCTLVDVKSGRERTTNILFVLERLKKI